MNASPFLPVPPPMCSCGEFMTMEMEHDCRLCVECQKAQATGTPTVRERFFNFVQFEPMSGCWLWSGATWGNGYGYFSGSKRKGTAAHRYSFLIHKGPIPEGLQVLHSCDNPACVNPDHLRIGSHDENMSERNDRCRQARGESIWTNKITEHQVIEIRLLHSQGCSQAQLAKEYQLHPSTVSRIVRGERWNFVDKPAPGSIHPIFAHLLRPFTPSPMRTSR